MAIINSSCVLKTSGNLTPKSALTVNSACTISTGAKAAVVVKQLVLMVPRWVADAEGVDVAPHTTWISNGKQPLGLGL